jgi:putative methionine-R-sulfoxide reductase with GAF domain
LASRGTKTAESAKASRTNVSDPNHKPALDEQTFGKLLEAAYVLQEHNRQMRQIEARLEQHTERLRQEEAETQSYEESLPRPAETRPDTDYTRTLAEIVEAQHQIQIRHLESDDAMAAIAERTARIIGGSGAGIGILEGKMIRYHAGAGSSALPAGSEVPLETAICAICVRTGQVLRTPDVNTEFLFDPEICHPREILSLVAVPIYHDGNIVGALEVYFPKLQGFVEQDVHTCRLMAGLVTETIGRSSESALKKSVAEERSSMMAAIDQLRPNLLPLAEKQPDVSRADIESESVTVETVSCWKCGNALLAGEQFCGKCGAPRSEKEMPGLPGNLASPWNEEPGGLAISAEQTHPHGGPLAGVGARLSAAAHEINLPNSGPVPVSTEETEPATAAKAQQADEEAMQTALSIASRHRGLDLENASEILAKAKTQDGNWSSASKARDFLENLGDTPSTNAVARLWGAHRGDFYLAVAVILVLGVFRWGMMPSSPVSATDGNPVSSSGAQRKVASDANLSTFDKLLISLGLAEAPEEPTEDKGNPETQVWIDQRTALYYCPGSDLYGKTERGRFASQRDAQLDQFEPALRKACN